VILCDAGVLLCLVDRTQLQHNAYRATITGLAKPLLTTWAYLTEAMYLALHRGGWAMQKQLGQLLLDQLLVIYEIQQDDHARLLTLMENIEIDQWTWQMQLWFWWLKRQDIGRFLLSTQTFCFIGLAIEIPLM